MFEMKITIEAKDLTEAINKLADAISEAGRPFTFMPDDVEKVEVKAPEAVVEQPKAPEPTIPQPEPVKAPEMPKPAEPERVITRPKLFARCSKLVQEQKIQLEKMTGLLQEYNVPSLPELSEEQVQMFWGTLTILGLPEYWEELEKMGV